MHNWISNVTQLGRIVFGTLYLLVTLISIPISFKIGGLNCGLAFTVTLFNLYFVSTTLSILARRNGSKLAIFGTSLLYYCQHFIMASLLFIFLSGFSNQEFHHIIENNENDSLRLDSLRSILLNYNNKHDYDLSNNSIENWIFYYYYYKYVITPWKFLLSHSTPFFTLSEGFFTILAIQAIGETNNWLSNEIGSNSWIITSLLLSGGFITGSLYYLYRIYTTQIWKLTIQTASLLGFVLSIVGGLSIYGIMSYTGSVLESSLFFTYIVRCLYEISPNLATTATDEILELFKDVWQRHQTNLLIKNNLNFNYHNIIFKNFGYIWDNIISRTQWNNINKNILNNNNDNFNKMINNNNNNNHINNANNNDYFDYYNLLLNLLSYKNKILIFLKPIWKFCKNFTLSIPISMSELGLLFWKLASESISPAVLINLCFRILIFYSATKIIPALQRKDNVKQLRRSRKIMKLIYWYSPCILIAMYAHLILQYSGELKNELCLWNCNYFSNLENANNENEMIIVDAWSFWNWCNIFWTILIYASELIGGRSNNNNNDIN